MQKFPKGSIKLRTHLKKFHNNDSSISSKLYKFECQKCYSRFKSAEILKSHIQTKHEDNKIKCPYCPYMLPLKRKSDLYRHHYRVAHPELTADIIKGGVISKSIFNFYITHPQTDVQNHFYQIISILNQL